MRQALGARPPTPPAAGCPRCTSRHGPRCGEPVHYPHPRRAGRAAAWPCIEQPRQRPARRRLLPPRSLSRSRCRPRCRPPRPCAPPPSGFGRAGRAGCAIHRLAGGAALFRSPSRSLQCAFRGFFHFNSQIDTERAANPVRPFSAASRSLPSSPAERSWYSPRGRAEG